MLTYGASLSELSCIEFPNGSDHAMIACYLELYEEGEVKHINGVWPNSKHPQLVGRTILYNAHRKRFAHA